MDGFDVYPDGKKEYTNFMDHVRVWINSQYMQKRVIAKNYIIECVEKKGISIIIMDYILGGAHHCLTGVDLADMINDGAVGDAAKRIIFLSKVESNDKGRIKNIEEYEKNYPETSIWVSKGYLGDEILEKEYFMNNVMPKIRDQCEKVGKNNKVYKLKSILSRRNVLKSEARIQYETSFEMIEKIINSIGAGGELCLRDYTWIIENDSQFGEREYINKLKQIVGGICDYEKDK
jgi:hypothetical protein